MVMKWRAFSSFLANGRSPERNGWRHIASQIQNFSCSGELRNDDRKPDEISEENRTLRSIEACKTSKKDTADKPYHIRVIEIAKEISKFIRANPDWEEKLLQAFPRVNFGKPPVYKEILRAENDVLLCLRFYYWLRNRKGLTLDPALGNMIFGRLVKADAPHAAMKFLDDTGFDPNPEKLELYARCLCKAGFFDDALSVIKRLRDNGNPVSRPMWNFALSCAVAAGRGDAVAKLQQQMGESGVETEMTTIGCNMQALCFEKNTAKAYEVLRQVMMVGQLPDNIFLNRLISALCRSGDFDKVSEVLHHMISMGRKPDIYTYKVIIHELCKQGRTHEGFMMFKELKRRGYYPETVMYTLMIHALCNDLNIGDAKELWSEMISNAVPRNGRTYNVMLDGLWKSGLVHEAEMLYKEMVERGYGETLYTYNTMITGLCLNGNVEEAHRRFMEMDVKGITRNFITYCVMINGFIQQGDTTQALRLLYESADKKIMLSTSTLVQLLTRLSDEHVEEAIRIWNYMNDKCLQPSYLCLKPIIGKLSNQENIDRAIHYACLLINKGHRPSHALSELAPFLSTAEKLDSAFFIRSLMLKSGFLVDQEVSNQEQYGELALEK